MNFQPSPKQVLVLWNLLFTGEEPMISKIQPALTPKERRQLEAAGLIEIERRGRAGHVLLTEKGWAWAAGHLQAEISQSKYAVKALKGLLGRLKTHLERQSLSLAEFLSPEEESAEGPAARPAVPDLPARIRSAYLQASGGRTNVRVRLKDLRPLLPDLPRTVLDLELLRLQRQIPGELVLWSLDDPQEITAEDQAAAVDIAGIKRHIIYMEA